MLGLFCFVLLLIGFKNTPYFNVMRQRHPGDSEQTHHIDTPDTEAPIVDETWRTMPVVDIPARHGLEGLFSRFESALEKYDLQDEPDIWWAMRTAFTVHSRDKRTNGHYTEHLTIVALEVIEDYGILEPDSDISREDAIAVICAALLHDSIEDHPKDLAFVLSPGDSARNDDEQTARDKAYAALHERMPLTADIVLAVSNPVLPRDENGKLLVDKIEAYTEHTRELLENPQHPYPLAGLVKLSDFRHNAVNNHLTLGPKRGKLDKKYIIQFPAYLEFIYSDHCPIKNSEIRQEIAYDLWTGHDKAITRLQKDEHDEKRRVMYEKVRSGFGHMAVNRFGLNRSKTGSTNTDLLLRDDTEFRHP